MNIITSFKFKPIKPSEYYKNNPNANNEIFWIYDNTKYDSFFIVWEEDIPELTFENSPKEVELKLK